MRTGGNKVGDKTLHAKVECAEESEKAATAQEDWWKVPLWEV